MEKNDELQKKARDGQMAIKGTVEPDVTSDPVAPARPAQYDVVAASEGRNPWPQRDPDDDAD